VDGRAGLADHVRCTLGFASGLIAELESSRVAEARDRVMEIGYADDRSVKVDFIAKTFEASPGLALNPDFADDPAARDSLGANVGAFLDTVRGVSTGYPAADGEDGRLALETALRIDTAAGARSRL